MVTLFSQILRNVVHSVLGPAENYALTLNTNLIKINQELFFLLLIHQSHYLVHAF